MHVTPGGTSVEVDDRGRLVVALGSLATIVVGIVVLVVHVPVFGRGGIAVVVIGVFGLIGVFARGGVRAVELAPDGVTVRTRDGVVRTIARAQIGGIGVAGKVAANRTVDLGMPVAGTTAGTSCRLVVVDPTGRVITARRAGWLRVDQLEAAARAHGYGWLGVHHSSPRGIDLAPAPWPTDIAPATGAVATDDPATIASLDGARRRQRMVSLASVGVLLGGALLAGVIGHLWRRQPGTGLAWAAGGASFVAFWVLVTGPLRSRPLRQARKLLRGSAWQPVEAIVVPGTRRDASKRTVVLLDPATGLPLRTMAVEAGGERGWLQPLDRQWFLIAVDARNKHAILAPPDRSAVASLLAHDGQRDLTWASTSLVAVS